MGIYMSVFQLIHSYTFASVRPHIYAFMTRIESQLKLHHLRVINHESNARFLLSTVVSTIVVGVLEYKGKRLYAQIAAQERREEEMAENEKEAGPENDIELKEDKAEKIEWKAELVDDKAERKKDNADHMDKAVQKNMKVAIWRKRNDKTDQRV